MTERELPPGWAWARLGDLGIDWRERVDPQPGTTYELWSVPAFSDDAPEICDGSEIRSSKISTQADDVLICKINPRINRVWRTRTSHMGHLQIASPEWVVLRLPEMFRARLASYLKWYLSSPDFRSKITSKVSGVTGSHTRAKSAEILDQLIPVPPLAEQERIVDTLEDHLSRLDAASENLRLGAKRIPVLRGGVRSQLVCLNNPTTRLPEGWSWGVLSDVLAEIQAGKSFRCEPRPAVPGEWGIVKVSAMTWGEFRPSENKAVIAGREIEERHEIRPGDILVSRANTREYVGASVIVRTCPPRLLLSDKSLRLVPKPEVDREWLLQVLSSPYVRRQISEKATGTKDSMRNISQKALRQIRIAIPPMGDMESIGADVSAALVQVEELNDSLCRSIARATNLRWGILKRAFSGKLVRQNSSEESASILLERIRADRATQPKLKRRRAAEVVVTSARPAPPVSSDPAGTFVQEELGL